MKEFDYAFLFPGFSFSPTFVSSWTNTVCYMYETKQTFCYKMASGSLLSIVRNHLLSHNLDETIIEMDGGIRNTNIRPFNDELKVKKVIFIDSDIVWTIEDLKKIIHSPHEVICGTYILGNNKFLSTMNFNNKFLTLDELNAHKEPFKIRGGGLGFVAVDLKILQEIEYPWFNVTEYWYEENGKKYAGSAGEDFYFFSRINDMGYDVYCDPTVRLKHEKTQTLAWHIQ